MTSSDSLISVISHLTAHRLIDESNAHKIYSEANNLYHSLYTLTDLSYLNFINHHNSRKCWFQ
jgi:hypothetical protein